MGFWNTAELNKAVEKGYIINQIYEVLHFENTSTDLWKEYKRRLMKIKLETSPFTCDEMVYRDKTRQLGNEVGELKKIQVYDLCQNHVLFHCGASSGKTLK